MAALNNLDIDKSSWLKWQIAVAIGAPVVLGIGYWYIVRRDKGGRAKGTIKEYINTDKQNKVEDISVKTSAAESLQKEPAKSLTPLERAQELKNSGNKFFKSGKYDDAIRCYSEAIEICPQEQKDILSTFYQNRAAAHEQKNNLEGVIEDCKLALELNPRYTKALHRRAKATEHTGDLVQSLEDITAVCILENFQNNGSLLMADRLLKQLGKTHAKEAMVNRAPVMPSNHFIKTYFSSFANDPLVAENNTKVNGHVNTEVPVSDLDKAKEALRSGDYNKVIPACTLALENSEENLPEALLMRATMYILRGQHVLALDDLEDIVNNPNCDKKIKVNALIKRASLYIQTEQREKCFEDFALAEEVDPDNSDIYHHRGQVHLLLDKVLESLSDFTAAVQRSPDFPIAVVQRQYVEYRSVIASGDLEAAAQLLKGFKTTTEKFPQCVEVYTLYAQVLMDKQDFEEADKQFQSAILIDPQNAQIRVHRGLLHLQWKGDLNTTVNMINEAIAIDERCEFCYETLGTIEIQRGNLVRAIELFEKAIPLAKSELEMIHLFSLKDAAVAQKTIAERFGLSVSAPLGL